MFGYVRVVSKVLIRRLVDKIAHGTWPDPSSCRDEYGTVHAVWRGPLSHRVDGGHTDWAVKLGVFEGTGLSDLFYGVRNDGTRND